MTGRPQDFSEKTGARLRHPKLAPARISFEIMNGGSAYAAKVKAELAHFRSVEHVHDLPDIFHYWSRNYLRPKIEALGFESIEKFFLDYIIEGCEQNKTRCIKIISFGSGNCDLEIGFASKLIQSEVTNFHLTCLELNEEMLRRGVKLAGEKQCSASISFECCDLNSWTAKKAFDVALAVHSLHHVVSLESLFDQISKGLTHDGTFLVHDMIGRNGHMRWPEALEVVQRLWNDLPRKYKYNHQLRRFEDKFVNRDYSTKSFEGIRAQDILPELIKRFEFEVFLGFGNIIDTFINRAFGHNFNSSDNWDRAFIERVAEEGDQLIEAGRVKPTQMVAALKHRAVRPRFYKHLTPDFCVRCPE